MNLIQPEGTSSERKSQVLDDYLKLKENFSKSIDGLASNSSSNTVTSAASKSRDLDLGSYKDKDSAARGHNAFERQNRGSYSHINQPSGELTIQNQYGTHASNKDNYEMLSASSKRSSIQEAPNSQLSKHSHEQKGSFKKSLINRSVQRSNQTSSYTSPSNLSCQILNDSRSIPNIPNSEPCQTEKNNPNNKIVSEFIIRNKELSEPAESKQVGSNKDIAHVQEPDEEEFSSGDSQALQHQAGFEQATLEALKNLSNKLFTVPRENTNNTEVDGKSSSVVDNKATFGNEAVASTSSEVFMNVLKIAAMNERRNLLNISSQLNSVKTSAAKIDPNDTNNHCVEDCSSDEEPVGKKASTPAHVTSSYKKHTPNESLNKGHSHPRNMEVDVSGDPCTFNYSEVKSPAKEDVQDVQGFTGFVSPMSPQHEGNQTIQLSNLYALNNTMHQLLGLKYQEESFERGVTGNFLKSNNSHNVSFSVDQPLVEREGRPTEGEIICSADKLRKQEVEPDYLLQSPPQDQNDGNRASQNFGPSQDEEAEFEEMMTSRKSQAQLVEASKRINVRTFLMLKNIIKPNDNILYCSQAFTKLFAGLSDVIPVSFAIMDNVEWSNIKVLFNSPLKVLNLVTSLPRLIEQSNLPQRNINAALNSLSKIQYDQDETQTDAFYQMYEFVVSALEYYKFYKPDYISSREQSPEKSTSRPNRAQNQDSRKSNLTRKSKSPYKQPNHSRNPNTETTGVSTGRMSTNRSVSPINAKTSSQKVLRSNANKNNIQDANTQKGLKTAPAKRAAASKTPVPSRDKEGPKPNQQSKTPVKNLRDAFNDSYIAEERSMTQEIYQNDPTFFGDRLNTHEVENEVTRLDDDIERKNREAREYRAKASRLLIDHERYIKKLQKTREIIKDEIDREHELQDRRDMSNYLEARDLLDKHYHREIIEEEFEAQKELKDREKKLQLEDQDDELLENLKDHCYLTGQKERKKIEKKKLLWEQYKKISAERLAKRQKETEESIHQKREIATKRIDDYTWKKQQVTQSRDKYKGDYELLSKLIGDSI